MNNKVFTPTPIRNMRTRRASSPTAKFLKNLVEIPDMVWGFTLTELLVVAGIIILLTALILPNFRLGERQLALQRSIHKLAQDIRRAQEMAMSAKELQGSVPPGYGIALGGTIELDRYILFADDDGNQDFGPGDREIEIIEFERNVRITSLSADFLRIIFTPPDPTVTINPDPPAVITLQGSKTVTVNEAGLIDID